MDIKSASNFRIPPSPDQFEVTLIGTGGGYGESVVVHLGNNEWIIIDSCKDPNSGSVLPLEYFNSIGINPADSVKLIVCTHWHDDHILGMSKILESCPNAEIVFARVNDTKKFLRLVGLDHSKIKAIGSISSTKEFNNCLDIIEKRGKNIKVATIDRLLYKTQVDHEVVCEVHALSPSDEAIAKFDDEISMLITEYGDSRKKIVIDSPNDKSVVIYLRLGMQKVLLGADLEVTSSPNNGWLDIINNSVTVRDERASYFKISHHGSENGYHKDIWLNLLEDNPCGTLTPWNRGNGLPTPEMIRKLRDHSDSLYITSPKLGRSKAKKRDRDIQKIIEKFKFKLGEIKFNKGIIRSRRKNGESKWDIEVFESALKI